MWTTPPVAAKITEGHKILDFFPLPACPHSVLQAYLFYVMDSIKFNSFRIPTQTKDQWLSRSPLEHRHLPEISEPLLLYLDHLL